MKSLFNTTRRSGSGASGTGTANGCLPGNIQDHLEKTPFGKRLKRALKVSVLLILGVSICIYIGIQFLEPSNDRDWVAPEKVLAYADIYDTTVHVHNIRDFRYKTEKDYTAGYYDKIFLLSSLESVDYIVEPFTSTKGAAHVFVSFGFENAEYVCISVEIRKEEGEDFSALLGILRKFEIMYVIADERDIIDLRANVRNDEVRIYPVKATREQAREMFLAMLKRANHLVDHPEFYNTLTNNCALNVVRHANHIVDEPIPYGYKLFFPAFSGRLAYQLGMIDTNLTFKEASQKYLINSRAKQYRGHKDFSVKIRN